MLQGPALRLVLDTTPNPGTGCGQGHRQPAGRRHPPMAAYHWPGCRQEVAAWAEPEGYDRYREPGIKGSTEVDWSNPEARRGFLAAIVADAERLPSPALTSPPSGRLRAPGTTADYGGGRAAVAGHGAPAGRGGGAGGREPGPHRLGLRPGDAPGPQEQPPALRRPQGGPWRWKPGAS